MDIKKAKIYYNNHMQTSRKRGILFLLTFEEWSGWWEACLGPDWLNLRGRGRGKYVMARVGDKGSYKLGNIKCITTEQNNREAKHDPHMYSKIPVEIIKEIYTSDGCMAELSQKYSIGYHTIYDLRHDRSWTKVTKGLNRGSRCPCSNGEPCRKGFNRLSNTV